MKFNFNMGKVFNFLLPVLLFLTQWFSIAGVNISWMLSGVLLVCIFKKKSWLIHTKCVIVFSLIVIVCPISNLIFSRSSAFMYNVYISILTGLICILYILSLAKDMYEVFIRGVIFSCVLFALWGIFEIYTGTYLVFTNDAFTTRLNAYGRHYPGVLFTNTNDIAQYLVLMFSVILGYLWSKEKILSVFMAIAIMICAYHAESRLSMICLVIFFALSWLLKMFFARNVNGILRLFLMALIVLLTLVIVENRTGLCSIIIEKYLVVDWSADYTTGRGALYRNILEASKTLPFGGFGTSYVVNEMPAHNLFLFILCDYGWIPATLFIILLVKMFFTIWYSCKKEFGDMKSVFMLAGLCIFPIMSCVSSVNEQRKVTWLFLGIMLRFFLEQRKRILFC